MRDPFTWALIGYALGSVITYYLLTKKKSKEE